MEFENIQTQNNLITSQEGKNKIKEFFENNGITLSEKQSNQFYKYYLLLSQWNEKFNLTAITEFNDVIVKHFYDSSVCYNLLYKNTKVIDIGCGAGFPSIPLKILRPDLELTLVDSVNKKITFINALISELGLENTKAIHTRVEDLAHNNNFREKFDYVVSRAVASLNVLCEYCLPFVRVGGTMLAYKSVGAEDEVNSSLKAISCLGGVLKEVADFTVADYCRKVIFINKVKPTLNKFPRGNNKPRTSPLL